MIERLSLSVAVPLAVALAGCGSFDAAPAAVDGGRPASEADASPDQSGPVALYTFEEGRDAVVHDRSGVEPALDLQIGDTGAVRWGPDGLTLALPVLVESSSGATKIFEACAASDAVSVEAWIRPETAAQGGPARIVTMSDRPDAQNFLLAVGEPFSPAEASRYLFRLSAPDGTVFVATEPGLARAALQHVVATADFRQAATMMYVDGVPVARGRLPAGDTVRSTWIGSRPLVLGGERQVPDRRFLGTYSRVAIYARALSADDVRERFADKPRP